MKESRKQNNAALPKEELREKLYYLKRSIFHPFDGFYEIRFRRKGSTLLAVALLLIFGVLRCGASVHRFYHGYQRASGDEQRFHLFNDRPCARALCRQQPMHWRE